jgi:hypothetical protein
MAAKEHGAKVGGDEFNGRPREKVTEIVNQIETSLSKRQEG